MPPEPGAAAGQAAHFRALESLYRAAPINRLFDSEIEIAEPGFARIRFEIGGATDHAAGAAHGTLYFKMMDDAAFYACNAGQRPLPAHHRLQPRLHPAAEAGPRDRRGALGQRPPPRLRR
jgi:hypothetical protein